MKKFRTRLAVIFLLLIGLTVVAFGLISSNVFRQTQLDISQVNMIHEMNIILLQVKWKTDGSLVSRKKYFATQAMKYKKLADERVTFIAPDGTVLGDSEKHSAGAENQLQQPEVRQALKMGQGGAVRYSAAAAQEMKYTALAVRKNGSVLGIIRLAKNLNQIEQANRKLWKIWFLSLIGLFAAAGIISYSVAGRMSVHLERATKVATEISRMNYKERVDKLGNDEIGDLGRAINTMADSLSEQMIRLREEERRLKSVLAHLIMGVIMIDDKDRFVLANRSAETILGFRSEEVSGQTFDHLTESKELHELMQECRQSRTLLREEIHLFYPEERVIEVSIVPVDPQRGAWYGMVLVLHDITAIRRLERMRSEFVANVSHELKTPVAAIKGFAETLLAGAMQDPEASHSFLKIIHEESDRLNRLIEDILELSKIESKRTGLHHSPIHLPSFIDKMVEVMKKEALGKEITLEARVDGELYIEADEDRLQQILVNLISNGIHYTPEGGEVRVIVEPVNGKTDYDEIRITVQDTGIGIPKKDIPRIFERFYRVDKARSRRSGGTGLGLSIVKHLVELHHGNIKVESAIGIGSRFILDLPAMQTEN